MTQINIPSPSKGQRNSSIELYRIIATFAVLIVHFNGWFVGGMPENFDISNPSAFRTGQMIIEAATCICVNMFVLISGYFGIRFRLYSFVSLCLKLLLIFIPLYIAYAIYANNFSWGGFNYQFRVISRAGWFIQCYVMLMFLSPLLNSFVKEYDRKILPWCIVLLFIEFWFGCVMSVQLGRDNSFAIESGYSVIHFVLIYMLGRCIYLYQDELTSLRRNIWVIVWIICTLIICVMHILGIKFVWDYASPIVIASSVASFMPFLYRAYTNEKINWIAKSTLAVYIIHSDTPVIKLLRKIDNQLLEDCTYSHYLLEISVVIVLVFFACIVYDKLCGIVINPVLKRLSPILYGKFEFK